MDDGTVEGRTAAMFEDYQGEPGNSGETVYTESEMTSMVVDAAARQIDVHIHALGERAIHEALNAIDAAYQLHMESEIGSIEVGKKADLVVLGQNLFDVDRHDIHKVGVTMTILDGDVVFEQDL